MSYFITFESWYKLHNLLPLKRGEDLTQEQDTALCNELGCDSPVDQVHFLGGMRGDTLCVAAIRDYREGTCEPNIWFTIHPTGEVGYE